MTRRTTLVATAASLSMMLACADDGPSSSETSDETQASGDGDGTGDLIGGMVSYEGVVGSALDYVEIECDDVPDKLLKALFFLIPEG